VAGSEAEDDRPENPELFISYASSDLNRAAALQAHLAAEGFCVWFDKVRLTPGCDWHKEIEVGCEAARVMLPLITPRWAESEWTRYETYAHDAVIPVLAEGNAEDLMPPPLRRWNAVTLDPLATNEAVWRTLLAAIRAKLAEPSPEQAPRIVDLPYPANPFFTGRDDDLVRIHEELHAAPVAALTQSRVRALAAMGGIGKTTLANEYARRYWRLYSQILWVDGRAGLETGFALLFGKLFPGRSDAGMRQSDKAKLVLVELASRAQRLLVLDNVEDADGLRPWLPRDPTTGCRTLITSRFADWSAAGIRAIQLDVLGAEPARQFLLARTRRTADGAERAACDDLARELGYLPLALEQAAAYIAAPGAGVDFAGYLRLYREATQELLTRGALGSTEYPDPVITTWQATVAKLSPESRAVLRLCAWYADTLIPRELVMEGTAEVLALAASFGTVAPLSGPAVVELRMRDALTGLARYSMILDATDTTFRMHGLVQTVERVRAEADGAAAEARYRALTRLTDLFPRAANNDPAQWPLCRLLLPHQQALLTQTFPDSAIDRTATLLNLTGSFLLRSGDAAGALPLSQRALESCEHVLGPEHPNTLTSLSTLAGCMRALGDVAEALPLYRRALESCERVLGPEDPSTLACLGNLALCLRLRGDAKEALPLYRRALESRERTLGPEHPDTLRSIGNLAGCLEARGDAKEALPLYRRALESSERVHSPEHPDTLTGLSNLAGCMWAQGDAAGALPLSRRALEGSERVLGTEHPDTLKSVSQLALCLQALGDAAGALPLHQRALECRERLFGPEHPDTLNGVNNLAECLRELGDAAGALPLHQRALECRERLFGPEHPDTLCSIVNLAGCLYALGDAKGALPLLRRAADGFDRLFGPDHPTGRKVRANCDLIERKIGGAHERPSRQTAV